jgi:NAD+ synthase
LLNLILQYKLAELDVSEHSSTKLEIIRAVKLTDACLKIDAEKYCHDASGFIKDKMTELRRNGIVVPISGGIDSSVAACLCVNAVGRNRVTGLLLPEKQGNPEAVKYAGILAEYLRIKTKKIDISRVLKSLGTYDFILNKIPSRELKARIVGKYLDPSKESMFIRGVKGRGNKFINRGIASFYTKQRVRLVAAYKFAEENNLLVVGSAHKSEDMVGLYVKFGVDDMADVMPLKNLYRTHIIQLAQFLGVPGEIASRTPNPDLVPGISDKYRDILQINWRELDLVLYGLEKKLSTRDVARQIGLDVDKVEQINEMVGLTFHMRNHSMAPDYGIP